MLKKLWAVVWNSFIWTYRRLQFDFQNIEVKYIGWRFYWSFFFLKMALNMKWRKKTMKIFWIFQREFLNFLNIRIFKTVYKIIIHDQHTHLLQLKSRFKIYFAENKYVFYLFYFWNLFFFFLPFFSFNHNFAKSLF